MKLVKNFSYFLFFLILFFLVFYYKEDILVYYNQYVSKNSQVPTTLEKNEYFRNYNFKYVSIADSFLPNNQQDIINIYYTIINSGMEKFTFYCPNDYENCLNDVKDIANDQTILSNINNFVHPYNGFKDIQTEIDSLGKIVVYINHNYTEEMKIILNYEIDKIMTKELTDSMDLTEKIKVIHDYIINNTKYDKDRSDNNVIKYKSDTAYGALIEGYALCSGYTDSMMLFLEKLNVKNYKKSSDNHVWNNVYIDNKWYNLDLTWDDPVNSDGSDTLEHTFFLISDKEMLQLDKTEHTYDKSIYAD